MINAVSAKKKKYIFTVVMVVMLILQLAVLFGYGSRKTGFHEDELYTYYSTNKTAGLFINDRQWMERDDLRNDFIVLEGEQFRYGVVKQMQSWDVHPPLYYYIFHTVCSLVPGVFSKWLGISVNLIAYVFSYVLLSYVVYTAITQGETNSKGGAGEKRAEIVPDVGRMESRGRILAFLTCLGWGFSAAVISGVMFIRMYQWLTLFVLLCLALHLRAMKKQDFRVRSFLLPLGVTVFLGFLTQYYYIIFHFFLGAGFCFYLLVNKKIRELISYAITCAVGLGSALIYYPSALSHIFRGYRGTEAVSEFSNASNTWDRLQFFYGLFDDYMLYDTLSVWLLTLVLLAVTVGYLKKRGRLTSKIWNAPIGLMAFTAAGYFFTISKTALLLGETSNRYQLPVYGVLVFLLLYLTWMYVGSVLETFKGTKRYEGILAAVLLVVLLIIDGMALAEGRVFFLYEEQEAVKEYVKANSDAPMVVFYNEASGDHIWWLSDELMEFPKVYLASQGSQEPISDATLISSDRILAYVADYDNKEQVLEGLLEVNENLTSYEVVADKEAWSLYVLE